MKWQNVKLTVTYIVRWNQGLYFTSYLAVYIEWWDYTWYLQEGVINISEAKKLHLLR